MFPYKLTAFDLDGTLTRSKTPITPEMASLLQKLSETTKVAIISGGSIVQFEKQLLPFIKPSENIILLPVDGSERFEYDSESKKWQLTDKHEFKKSIKEKVIKALDEIIDSGLFEIPKEHQGKYIEDRDTEINLSAMGQDASLEIKEKWDPDQKKRRKIEKEIERKIPEVDATVAGTTSVDILPKGFDKAYGLGILLEKIKIDKKDVIFLGDAVFPGGNDYSVMADGIKTVKVDGPDQTRDVIKNWFGEKNNNPIISIPKNPIAYFCAEYAIEENTLMYAGGLGILAGDYLMEMADKNMPFIAMGLNYNPGNLKDFSIFSHQGEPAVVSLPIGEHLIYAQVWHRRFAENTHVFLLDTNFEKNDDEHKNITSHLYDSHFYTRVKQQIVLGIGGIKLFKLLDIHPSVYHLNEGHTAFAGVGVLVERNEDVGKIVGTKHTILSAAGLYIPKKDFFVLLNTYCKEFGVDINEIFEKGKYELDPDTFSTTKLVMTTSKIKNSVSALHAVFEKIRHPHSELISITNGVYRKRWQVKEFITRNHDISSKEIWEIKKKLRIGLVDYIRESLGKKLNPDVCTVVWARRFAAYKRPFLLFSDYERVKKIIRNQENPVQFVIAGKAHEADGEGQEIIKKIMEISEDPETMGRVVYIPNYSVAISHELVKGADIWLNTPERGKEACGTSGMKASLNGALQCSISDGWVDEVNWVNRGWILPEENTAQVLYDLLEHEILPCFYAESPEGSRENWTEKMRSTMELVEKSYTTSKMLDNYLKLLYIKPQIV